MKTSIKGINLIKKFEGEILHGYLCPAGKLTIGVGHVVLKGEPYAKGGKITADESTKILKKDLIRFEKAVSKFVKVELNQNQFDALVSFAFNVGEANLSNSTLLKKLNRADYQGAANEFKKWIFANGVKLKGLVSRRESEKSLFLS